jgi:hypothetical protein
VITGSFKTKLAPHACQVLAMRPMQTYPFLLSTSQHVTQGMTDVVEEKWEAATKTLSARSQVVAGDPYELRVVVPAPWKALRVETDSGEKAAIKQTGTELRATWTPTKSGVGQWKIMFD